MDAESSLIIATTKLGMTGNVAAFGSDIFNWNMVSPSISYLPSSSNAAFDVEGSVFFADQQVANAVASSNPFTWHQPQSSLAKTLLLCDVTASNHTLTSKACNQKTTPPANQNEPLPIHLLDPPTFILKFSIE